MGYTHKNSKGITYYLNSKKVTLRGGKEQVIYYFSKDERKDSAAELPAGFKVVESERNGFVTLKRA
ncbi:MAG TPA: hypothetical protein VLG11_03160 [Candidatus Saccharimonadales bacterium]|nr:hypothetical protein [Candidatus Saccharimonadales bacterium]